MSDRQTHFSDCDYPRCKCPRYGRCGNAKDDEARTIWHIVADLKSPTAEPFMVVRVDTSVRSGSGVEGEVISLHWIREDAERAARALDGEKSH